MAKEVNKSNKDKKNKKESKNSFFKEFKAELKRVSWPTLKQLVNNTVAVLVIVIVVSAIVFVLDVIFENLNTFGVEKLKALVTSGSSEIVDVETVEEENADVSNEAETSGDVETETTDTNTVVTEEETTENGEGSSVENNN